MASSCKDCRNGEHSLSCRDLETRLDKDMYWIIGSTTGFQRVHGSVSLFISDGNIVIEAHGDVSMNNLRGSLSGYMWNILKPSMFLTLHVAGFKVNMNDERTWSDQKCVDWFKDTYGVKFSYDLMYYDGPKLGYPKS